MKMRQTNTRLLLLIIVVLFNYGKIQKFHPVTSYDSTHYFSLQFPFNFDKKDKFEIRP